MGPVVKRRIHYLYEPGPRLEALSSLPLPSRRRNHASHGPDDRSWRNGLASACGRVGSKRESSSSPDTCLS